MEDTFVFNTLAQHFINLSDKWMSIWILIGLFSNSGLGKLVNIKDRNIL